MLACPHDIRQFPLEGDQGAVSGLHVLTALHLTTTMTTRRTPDIAQKWTAHAVESTWAFTKRMLKSHTNQGMHLDGHILSAAVARLLYSQKVMPLRSNTKCHIMDTHAEEQILVCIHPSLVH